jgi:hypothetical protein
MAGLLSSAFGFNESEGAVAFAWFQLVSPSSSARLSFCLNQEINQIATTVNPKETRKLPGNH